MYTCPYCGKKSFRSDLCSNCNKDISWVKNNNVIINNDNKSRQFNKQKEIPSLESWLEQSTLPDWIKSKILDNERKEQLNNNE